MSEKAVLSDDKKIKRIIWGITIVVYALVILLHELPQIENPPAIVKTLPFMNACINGICALLLITSLIAVKMKRFVLHQRINTLALILSAIFLLLYVAHHAMAGDTQYGGNYKSFYYFILISHILLAGLSFPFILFAFMWGIKGELGRHKRVVRITYPVWLYVTITGVMVYLFLADYY